MNHPNTTTTNNAAAANAPNTYGKPNNDANPDTNHHAKPTGGTTHLIRSVACITAAHTNAYAKNYYHVQSVRSAPSTPQTHNAQG